MPILKWRHAIPAAVLAFTLAASPPARAGWREDIGTFRIGLVTPGGSPVVQGAELMKQAYSDALGMPVEIFVARDLAALIDAHASKRIDYAAFSSIAYATAHKLCDCVVPLVSPTALSGATGIRMVLLRRKWVEGAGQMVVAVPPQSAFLPSHMAGIARRDVPADMQFTTRTAGSMEEAEALFTDGKVDGLLGWVEEGGDGAPGGTIARLARRGVLDTEYEVAWRSDPLRFGPHAVRRDLAPEAVQLLRSWLLELKQTKPDVFEVLSPQLTGGFVSAAANDYVFADEIVASVAPDQAGGQ